MEELRFPYLQWELKKIMQSYILTKSNSVLLWDLENALTLWYILPATVIPTHWVLLILEAMYAILFPLRFPLSLHPRYYLTANFGLLMSMENCRLQNWFIIFSNGLRDPLYVKREDNCNIFHGTNLFHWFLSHTWYISFNNLVFFFALD
jgi:hypothetical protein